MVYERNNNANREVGIQSCFSPSIQGCHSVNFRSSLIERRERVRRERCETFVSGVLQLTDGSTDRPTVMTEEDGDDRDHTEYRVLHPTALIILNS